MNPAVGVMMKEMIMTVEQACSECSGTKVFLDALASWNTVKQEWELHQEYDHAYCRDCDTECEIIERDITNE